MTKNKQYDILIEKFVRNENYREGRIVSSKEDIEATVRHGKEKSEPLKVYFSKPENVTKFKKMLSEATLK